MKSKVYAVSLLEIVVDSGVVMKTFLTSLLLLSSFSFLSAEEMDLVSVVQFDGTSTLHDFSGTATSQVARVSWTALPEGGLISAENITFKVEAITTDHVKRDKKMMAMFEPAGFPVITGSLQGWKLGDPENTKAVLILSIHGSKLEVPVQLSDYTVDETGIHFNSHFTLSLKACGLKRPSALGVIKVGDEVRLNVHTTLRKPDTNA